MARSAKPLSMSRQIAKGIRGDLSKLLRMHDAKAELASTPAILSTGIDTLDVALGCGGIPPGRVLIGHGIEGGGKSTLFLHVAAEAQKLDGIVVDFDFERKRDKVYAGRIGVNIEDVIIAYPRTIEEAFEFMEKILVETRKLHPTIPIAFLFDSLQAAAAKAARAAGYDTAGFPSETRAYSNCFKLFMPALHDNWGTLLCASQIRTKIEVLPPGMKSRTGPQERVGVGNAPAFYASVIAQFKKPKMTGTQTKTGLVDINGTEVEVVLRKNQVGDPHIKALMPLTLGYGVNKPVCLAHAARMLGLLTKTDKSGKAGLSLPERQIEIHHPNVWFRNLYEKDRQKFDHLREFIRSHIGKVKLERDLKSAGVNDLDLDNPDGDEEAPEGEPEEASE